jgi:Pou domain - N-terminal to homeobox domain
MRDLLAENDKRLENHFSMEQNEPHSHNGSHMNINQAIQDHKIEKTEREPNPVENQQPMQLPSSPMEFSNDSNSGDGNFEENQSELNFSLSVFLHASWNFTIFPFHFSTDEGANSQREGSVPEGIDLDEINEFAQAFKLQRLSLGLTQTQVGQALSVTEGPAYSQSAICRYLVHFCLLMNFKLIGILSTIPSQSLSRLIIITIWDYFDHKFSQASEICKQLVSYSEKERNGYLVGSERKSGKIFRFDKIQFKTTVMSKSGCQDDCLKECQCLKAW